jgi:hypothetical protein
LRLKPEPEPIHALRPRRVDGSKATLGVIILREILNRSYPAVKISVTTGHAAQGSRLDRSIASGCLMNSEPVALPFPQAADAGPGKRAQTKAQRFWSATGSRSRPRPDSP